MLSAAAPAHRLSRSEGFLAGILLIGWEGKSGVAAGHSAAVTGV